MTGSNENQETKNRPTHRLIQEKAFYRIDANGRQVRDKETIELARGWLQVSDNNVTYISWANSTIPVLPDVDGKIVRRAFEINYDGNKSSETEE